MKIFFFPNYFYLNLPVFERVIHALTKKKITSYIIKLSGNTDILVDKKFDQSYFNSKKLNYLEIPIYKTSGSRKKITTKIKLLINSIKNFRDIYQFLKKNRPDAVVVGSDLGNLNIRFLMDACYFCHIPIVILYSCDIPEFQNKNIFNFKYANKLKILNFFRAILFRGTTPGEYAPNSTICVASEQARQRLTSRSIDKNRIFVTGMPLFDASIKCSPENIFKKLGIPNNHKLVILFTEHIQNIYGAEYTKNLYFNLEKTIKNLDKNIFFLIKLHPLEDEEFKTFIKNVFGKSRCKIIENFDAEDLIAASDLCISFWSRVLITASLMGKRFLSINFKKDRKRTFMTEEEYKILEITNPENLKKDIEKALENPMCNDKMDKTIGNIAKRFSSHDSCEKIASIILNRISG